MRYHHLRTSTRPCVDAARHGKPCETRVLLAIAISAALWAGLAGIVALG